MAYHDKLTMKEMRFMLVIWRARGYEVPKELDKLTKAELKSLFEATDEVVKSHQRLETHNV